MDLVLEQLTLINNGNVGIGTTSPASQAKLDVNGRINADSLLIMANSSIGLGLQNTDNTNSAYIKNIGSSNETLLSIDEKIYVKEDGNVGIGTTSPSYKLDVREATNGTYAARILNHGGDSYGLLVKTSTQESEIFPILDLENASSNVFRVQSNGNVGIGTATPDNKLDIKADFENFGITISQSSANQPARINLLNGEGEGTIDANNGLLRLGNLLLKIWSSTPTAMSVLVLRIQLKKLILILGD